MVMADSAKIASWNLISMGVSSDSVGMLRNLNPGPNWNARLEIFKAGNQTNGKEQVANTARSHALATISASQQSALNSVSQITGAGLSTSYAGHAHGLVSKTELVPASLTHAVTSQAGALSVSPEKYRAVLSLKEARVGIPQPRQKDLTSSALVDKSKLIMPDQAVTQSMDFTAIADSSVGGSGLPRPYGMFPACRNGDGTAVWERAPPQPKDRRGPTKSNQDAMQDFRVSVKDELDMRVGSFAAASSPAEAPHTTRSAQRRVPKTEHVIRPTRASSERTRQSPSAESLSAPRLSPSDGVGAGTPPDQALVSARSEVSCVSNLFALPCATFLTEVPVLPRNVRVDLGTGSERAFLQSGLRGHGSFTGSGAYGAPRKGFTGVYVPMDSRTHQALHRRPPASMLGGQLSEEWGAYEAIVAEPDAPDAVTVARIAKLPREASLPRKSMPTGL